METNFYNYIGTDKLLYNIDDYLNENMDNLHQLLFIPSPRILRGLKLCARPAVELA